MKRRLASTLRRVAHRLDPGLITSWEVKWSRHSPEGWVRGCGEPVPEKVYVDLQFRTGKRVVGYVTDEARAA